MSCKENQHLSRSGNASLMRGGAVCPSKRTCLPLVTLVLWGRPWEFGIVVGGRGVLECLKVLSRDGLSAFNLLCATGRSSRGGNTDWSIRSPSRDGCRHRGYSGAQTDDEDQNRHPWKAERQGLQLTSSNFKECLSEFTIVMDALLVLAQTNDTPSSIASYSNRCKHKHLREYTLCKYESHFYCVIRSSQQHHDGNRDANNWWNQCDDQIVSNCWYIKFAL